MLPAVIKITAKIMLESIKEHLESLIDREQAGFPSGPHQYPMDDFGAMYGAYVFAASALQFGFEKAFDSVNMKYIRGALPKRDGHSGQLIAIFSVIYDDTKCLVLHQDKISKYLEVEGGAR